MAQRFATREARIEVNVLEKKIGLFNKKGLFGLEI
jgi:hypothetical protein